MGGGGGERRRKTSVLKRVAQKLFQTCASSFSFSSSFTTHPTLSVSIPPNSSKIIESDIISPASLLTPSSSKNLCMICLDPLSYSPSKAIFTAQCSHAFHFACIASNVRHGGVTCPVCRAQWTHLPHAPPPPLFRNQTHDPILQILDDSIATFRVHRRSFLRSARYDDDDPIEPPPTNPTPRLLFSLLFEPRSRHSALCASAGSAYLSVKLSHQPATDLVLVASPNGPHLRLMKQSMALVVFSLRPIDRLAIVTSARVFPLRRMTSYGKRAALLVIERLFFTGHADPVEGLKKGVKVLADRAHENPGSCILHLSDCNHHQAGFDMEAAAAEIPIHIHRFHFFGASSNGNMHEFEEFLGRVVGDSIRDIELRIGEEARTVRLCEMRGGEERRIPVPVNMGELGGHVMIEYSYLEGRVDECIRTGQVIVGLGRETSDVGVGRSNANANANWDYHDPYMARRWAKHLHGYRL